MIPKIKNKTLQTWFLTLFFRGCLSYFLFPTVIYKKIVCAKINKVINDFIDQAISVFSNNEIYVQIHSFYKGLWNQSAKLKLFCVSQFNKIPETILFSIDFLIWKQTESYFVLLHSVTVSRIKIAKRILCNLSFNAFNSK